LGYDYVGKQSGNNVIFTGANGLRLTFNKDRMIERIEFVPPQKPILTELPKVITVSGQYFLAW
jgi:hypothetical protein